MGNGGATTLRFAQEGVRILAVDRGARPGNGMLGIIDEHDDLQPCSLASRSCTNRRRADYNASRGCIGAAIIGAVAIRAAGERR
jgi:hypothetical protein